MNNHAELHIEIIWNNHTTPIADWLVNLFQAVQINPGYWRGWDESPSVTPVLAAIFWYFHDIFTLWKMNKASILAEALLVKAMKSFKSESWDRPSSRLPMCFMEASGCPKGEGPGKAKGFPNPLTLGASIGGDTKGCWENGAWSSQQDVLTAAYVNQIQALSWVVDHH